MDGTTATGGGWLSPFLTAAAVLLWSAKLLLRLVYLLTIPLHYPVYYAYSLVAFLLSPIWYTASCVFTVTSFVAGLVARLKYLYIYFACAAIIGILFACVLYGTSSLIFVALNIDAASARKRELQRREEEEEEEQRAELLEARFLDDEGGYYDDEGEVNSSYGYSRRTTPPPSYGSAWASEYSQYSSDSRSGAKPFSSSTTTTTTTRSSLLLAPSSLWASTTTLLGAMMGNADAKSPRAQPLASAAGRKPPRTGSGRYADGGSSSSRKENRRQVSPGRDGARQQQQQQQQQPPESERRKLLRQAGVNPKLAAAAASDLDYSYGDGRGGALADLGQGQGQRHGGGERLRRRSGGGSGGGGARARGVRSLLAQTIHEESSESASL